MTKQRLLVALGCYAILAILAWATLAGPLRLAVWVLMIALALKSWIAMLARRS